jgi:hypothetical protein
MGRFRCTAFTYNQNYEIPIRVGIGVGDHGGVAANALQQHGVRLVEANWYADATANGSRGKGCR